MHQAHVKSNRVNTARRPGAPRLAELTPGGIVVTLPDVVVERKSTRGEAALHVAVSKTSSTRRRHRRSEKDFERRRSSLIVGLSQTVSPAAPAGASRPRKPRRSATKEEKVGGGL